MTPAFQVHNFHGVFIFAFNQPMVTALDELVEVDQNDPPSMQEFKRALQRKKVNYQNEEGRPQLRSYKFCSPLILHATSDVAIELSEKMAEYEELPAYIYAFREKLGDRLRYVRELDEELVEAA